MCAKKKQDPQERVDEAMKKAKGDPLDAVNSLLGPGTVFRVGDSKTEFADVPAIPTGDLGIDRALGVGGFPAGRIVEVFGPEASGKTTLTLHAVANAQANGGLAAFIDAEHALDPVYARALGVDVDALLINQPSSGEQALHVLETMVRTDKFDLIVVDSVAALTPKAEIDGEMGDSHVGLHARLMSQAMRKLCGVISQTSTCVIFINQMRMKIGVMFGNPETTTGGNALKFYASQRLDIRRIGAIKEGDTMVGTRTRVTVVKNKVAAPFRRHEFDIMYGKGIRSSMTALDLGVTYGVVEQAGSWYSFNGDCLGQGRENAATFLEENREVQKKIEAAVRGAW